MATRLVAALRCAARERGGPLPSIDVADALLDERLRADRMGYNPPGGEFSQFLASGPVVVRPDAEYGADIDHLLDERLAHRGRPGEATAVET